MSEDEKEIEKPSEIVNLVKMILEIHSKSRRERVENTNTKLND